MTTSRQDLKAVLKPLVGSGWQVYDYPPDSMKSPAVTIEGADPWITQNTMGADTRKVQMNYIVRLWVQRTTPRNAYAKLESTALAIMFGLTDQRWKALEVSAIDTLAQGNVEYAVAEIVVSARLEAQ